MNKRIKDLAPVIAILLVAAVLVLARALNNNHFRPDAARKAEQSIDGSNIIAADKIAEIGVERLIINLSKAADPGITAEKMVKIAPEYVLDKQNLKLFRKKSCSVLLWSDEPSVAARVWMLLSQMGYRNVFILQTGQDNEVLKMKFRPDTGMVRPELH
ncbi:MAG TPA: hypothetical protein VHO68_11550 [Bacteroidales bacterium]|nr:hypothetical protein [Bacteroidales bacterium]